MIAPIAATPRPYSPPTLTEYGDAIDQTQGPVGFGVETWLFYKTCDYWQGGICCYEHGDHYDCYYY